MASPCGLLLASVSGIVGMPVESLKRAVTGTEGPAKWGAVESSFAAVVGVKLPVSSWPLACARGG